MALTLKKQREKIYKIEDVDLRISLLDSINTLIDQFGENCCVQSMSPPEANFNNEVRELIDKQTKLPINEDHIKIVYTEFIKMADRRLGGLQKLMENKPKEKQVKPISYNLPDE